MSMIEKLKKAILPSKWTRLNLQEFEKYVQEDRTDGGDKYHDKVTYDIVALAGEAGELLSEWKDRARERITDKGYAENVLLEAGDCLHYLVRVAHDFGYTLEDLAGANKLKLENRKYHGKGMLGKWS